MKKFKPYSREINIHSDDRGVFAPFLQTDILEKGETIKRIYYIYNYGKGIIRGFHFHKKEWKYFTVVNGAAKIVAIDPEKPDDAVSFISSSRKPNLVAIPPGYANGWMSLEAQTILLCGSTSTIEESIKDDQRYDPYKWGDVWTVKAR